MQQREEIKEEVEHIHEEIDHEEHSITNDESGSGTGSGTDDEINYDENIENVDVGSDSDGRGD
eukprot:UN10038